MTCSHRMCQAYPKGVAVCIVDPAKKRVLLGLERFGKYRGKYNLCAGSLEPEDEGCAVNAARRELWEEFKLSVEDFDRYFCIGRNSSPRTFMVGPTPVLVGHFDADTLSSADLTNRMRADIENAALPGTWKEMESARWFPWEEQASVSWSRFARVAMKKVANVRPSITPFSHKASSFPPTVTNVPS